MKIVDFVNMGIKNLWRRKLRTILTAIGVAIGTFSIVIMLSLGIAMTEGYKQQLSEWGSLTKINVERYSYTYDEATGHGASTENKLNDKLVQDFMQIKHVKAVTPILSVSATLKAGKYQSWLQITGIDPNVINYFDFPEIESGDNISADNPTGIVFGKNSYYFSNPKSNYYNDANSEIDMMNDSIKITFDDVWGDKTPKYMKLIVAGLYAESNGEANYSAYAPIEQVKQWYKDYSQEYKDNKELNYQSIWISVDDVNNVKEVQNKIKEMGYTANSMADALDNIKEMSSTLQLILGGIGAVSLLVSAIGIANTMIMSIYERTKEIGVMKVLGCVVTDIRKLFLFEACIIGFFGGTFGLGLSYRNIIFA